MEKTYYAECPECGASYTIIVNEKTLYKDINKICKKCNSNKIRMNLGYPKYGCITQFKD